LSPVHLKLWQQFRLLHELIRAKYAPFRYYYVLTELLLLAIMLILFDLFLYILQTSYMFSSYSSSKEIRSLINDALKISRSLADKDFSAYRCKNPGCIKTIKSFSMELDKLVMTPMSIPNRTSEIRFAASLDSIIRALRRMPKERKMRSST